MKQVYPAFIVNMNDGTKHPFLVCVPDLDILTEGDSFADAIEMARDAIGLTGISMEDNDEPLPSPSSENAAIEKVKQDTKTVDFSKGILTYVDVDFSEYRKKMDNTKPFITGAAIGLLIWVIMTLADAADEYIIDTESLLGYIMCFLVPLCLSVLYIIYYLKKKPSFKKILAWFSGFLSFGIIAAVIICNQVNYNRYIIDNSSHRGFMSLNGIEYYIYALFAIGGFTLISIIFHIIYAVVKHCLARKSKNKSKNNA